MRDARRRESAVIIINVSDHAATAALLQADDVAAALAGKLVVELHIGNAARRPRGRPLGIPSTARPISTAPSWPRPTSSAPSTATILVAGPRSAFDGAADVLRAMQAPSVQHVGDDPGRANALDSALLALMWGALFGALHAIAVLAGRADRARRTGTTVERHRAGGRRWARRRPDQAHRCRALASDAETLSSISPHYSAFQHLVELMETRGIDRGVVSGYDAIFQRAIAAGHLA